MRPQSSCVSRCLQGWGQQSCQHSSQTNTGQVPRSVLLQCYCCTSCAEGAWEIKACPEVYKLGTVKSASHALPGQSASLATPSYSYLTTWAVYGANFWAVGPMPYCLCSSSAWLCLGILIAVWQCYWMHKSDKLLHALADEGNGFFTLPLLPWYLSNWFLFGFQILNLGLILGYYYILFCHPSDAASIMFHLSSSYWHGNIGSPLYLSFLLE